MSFLNSDLILDHFESHFGPPEHFYNFIYKGKPSILQVIKFSNQPVEGAITFVTFGLSSKTLDQENKPPIYQELVFSCWDDFKSWDIPNVLAILGHILLDTGKALQRGQLIGIGQQLFERGDFEAFYCDLTNYFPDSFTDISCINPSLVFIWIIPIFNEEGDFIHKYGWDKFQNILIEKDPDLLDLAREIAL